MTYPKYVDRAKHFLLELFFPSFCLGCQKEGTYLCQDCVSTLEISEYTYCLCNKNPQRLDPQSKKGTCPRCQNKKLSGLHFALAYQEKLLTKKLIHQFKYEPFLKALARPLAGLILEHLVIIQKNSPQIWGQGILVPIPMERAKLKKRGYNQAEELAKELSKTLGIPCFSNILIKNKKTPPQAQLSAKERQENVKNAFSAKDREKFAGKKIFLVDDVYTTGATMEECARILLSAGAAQVWGMSIAREG